MIHVGAIPRPPGAAKIPPLMIAGPKPSATCRRLAGLTHSMLVVSLLMIPISAHSQSDNSDSFVHKAHAISMYDQPKYGPDFTHFDYVNPDAPKGGTMRLGAFGTFDSFHEFIPKGNAVGTGSIETLMVSSSDEPFTEYGLLAESLEWPEDRSWVIFNLRPEARWHDGEAITADDVVWTFNTLMEKGQPQYRFYYASVRSVEKLGHLRVRFNFSEANNRELPLVVGQLPVLPKHYWETRDFEKTTLEPPLGSGPYRVSDFEPGRYVVRERVADYWGRDLPVNQGINNFDRMRTEYFRDFTAIRLALRSGRIDFHRENQAKAWATDYDVPAVQKGWLNKELIDHEMPTGMQAFVYNTRRKIFADPLVRKALANAFDFEWTNRNLFHGQYTRTESYFSNSPQAATGLPEGEELEILERYRGRIPDEVFTTAYRPPSTDGSGWPRENLREAFDLLARAGWVVQDMKLVNADTGEPMTFEILLVQQAFERIILPFVRNLQRLGIDVRVRLVDTSQYVERLRQFDFDMFVFVWGQSETPGNEQREYWSSAAAENPSSRNFAGISDPVVDELIDSLIQSESRAQLNARTRALDRVLLHSYYLIPNWHLRAERILWWDKFSRPVAPVKMGVSTGRWWFDETRAAALEKARENDESLSASGEGEPSRIGTLSAMAVLLFIGWLLVRRVMRRT